MTDKPRRQSNRVPKHRKHATGQGIVTLGGKDFYTGKWGTAQSDQEYRRLVGEWITNGRQRPPLKKVSPAVRDLGMSVAELCTRFKNWATDAYRDDNGGHRSEFVALEWTAKYVSANYGLLPVGMFSRKHFYEMRDALVKKRLSRTTVNHRMSRVKKLFAWGEQRDLVPLEISARLAGIAKLKPGEEGVRETPRVQPVPDAVVEATLKHLRPQLQALVRILRRTGARVGEIITMRPSDLDRTKEVWVYTPRRHKASAHHDRAIYLGPAAREALEPMLVGVRPEEFVFKTPRTRKPFNQMDVAAAVKRAAANAAVKHWHVHQLRHARLTELRESMSLDHVQSVAGHTVKSMSEHYAKLSGAKAEEAAKLSG